MLINGTEIAESVYNTLKNQISTLSKKNIIPTLAIILVGNNPQSENYVASKIKAGQAIGVNVILERLTDDVSKNQIQQVIDKYNNDKNVHGLIVQIPVDDFDNRWVTHLVSDSKDVDGFKSSSKFVPPIYLAVLEILKYIHANFLKKETFESWIKTQKITVIGKGFTGGEPIYKNIIKLNSTTIQIDRSTPNPNEIIKSSDIIISAAGSNNVINSSNCKNGAILISVGLHEENGSLRGDYNEEEIDNIAAFYTPTPKGVGPVNVAFLFKNVIDASLNS